MSQVEENGSRVRMNFAQDAKGFVKMDLTVEFPTVEEAKKNGIDAIRAYREVCIATGLKILEAPI